MALDATPCFGCKAPVVYLETDICRLRRDCDAAALAFVLAVRQPAYLADGTLVVLEAGTVLTGHARHGPRCPARKQRGFGK
jgi:hypothetical protein